MQNSRFPRPVLTRQNASFRESELELKWHQPGTLNCFTELGKWCKRNSWHWDDTEKSKQVMAGRQSGYFASLPSGNPRFSRFWCLYKTEPARPKIISFHNSPCHLKQSSTTEVHRKNKKSALRVTFWHVLERNGASKIAKFAILSVEGNGTSPATKKCFKVFENLGNRKCS